MFKYILEIKNRSILLFLTWFSTVCVTYFYKETLLFLFIQSELFTSNEFKVYYFIFTDVAEVFTVYIRLIFFFSFQIFIVYFIYHSFIFVSSGLFLLEYYYFKYILKTSFLIWCFSILISKYVLIPTTWDFFVNFQNTNYLNLHFEAKLNEYLTFYIEFYYLFLIYCQLFTVFFLFFSYINVDGFSIKKFRKLYYYFLLLFSTLISPPEVLSQILISCTLILCYELIVILFLFKSICSIFLIRQPVKTN